MPDRQRTNRPPEKAGTDNRGLWTVRLELVMRFSLKTEKLLLALGDDGSVIWIDLDEDGDFSHSGMYGDEMVVDNKGGHGREIIGTRFLGRKSPIFSRLG